MENMNIMNTMSIMSSSEELETVNLIFGSLQGKDLNNSYAKPVLFLKYLYKYTKILF